MMKPINRRRFIQASLAGSASAFLTACTNDPVEELIPFLIPPDDFVPGQSIYFTTTCKECPEQCGMVVRTREGRAVKAEGNPRHPLNEGALCAVGQASLQGLYNPLRVTGPFTRTATRVEEITWDQGMIKLVQIIDAIKQSEPDQQLLYIGRPDSGCESALIDTFLQQIGSARRISFDLSPVNAIHEAGSILFGRDETPWYRFDLAERVINFGADYMESWLNPVESMKNHAKNGFSSTGRYKPEIFVGPRISLSGSQADHAFICKPGHETAICLAIAHQLIARSRSVTAEQRLHLQKILENYHPEKVALETGLQFSQLELLARQVGMDGKSLVIGGGNACSGGEVTELQVAIHLLNYLAGNVGQTVLYGSESNHRRHSLSELSEAITQMKAGQIGAVIFDNVNPAFALPEKAGFLSALKQVPFIVSLSTIEDETSKLADLHLPICHPLESWGDANPRQGIYSLQQPVMAPVPGYRVRQRGDLFLQLGKMLHLYGFAAESFFAHLKQHWQELHQQRSVQSPFESFWKESLQTGGYFEPFRPRTIALKPFWNDHSFPPLTPDRGSLMLLPVNTVFHNANGYACDKYWLHEIPDPITQVVWDSWAEIHPETAARLGIKTGDLIEISNSNGESLKVGAWLYNGIDKGCIALPTGKGRAIRFPDYTPYKRDLFIPTTHRDPRIMKTIVPGINPIDLIDFTLDANSGDLAFNTTLVSVKATGQTADLVTVDGHYGLNRLNPDAPAGDLSPKDRQLVRRIDQGSAGNKSKPDGHAASHPHRSRKGFYPKIKKSITDHPFDLKGVDTPTYHDPYRWELTIDLDRCTGCSACVIACYAENNIAVVGKERQAVGREMSWLRIERYFTHDAKTGTLKTDFIPQMCAQCENAGCEPVCPLYATYHNPDGINTMIYARCAGTRYCANNCIYKARRFNWRSYLFPSPLHLQLNPDVTVRDKGVMEKCTFCIQRIKDAKEQARKGNRTVRDGEIQTACEQSCPTQAIRFGNGIDKNSRIAKHKQDRRAYQQLDQLNYKPAITYLKKVTKA